MSSKRLYPFAVDGHDGAAKTNTVEAVKLALKARGLRVAVSELFKVAGKHAPGGKDIYPLWQSDPGWAIVLLRRAAASAIHVAEDEEADVLLFDRHWMTVMVEVIGTEHERLWPHFVPTFFNRAPLEKILSCSRFSFETPWSRSVKQVRDYRERYLAVAARFPEHILETFDISDKRVPLEPNVVRIVEAILDRMNP
jgi:thymidylate kinase